MLKTISTDIVFLQKDTSFQSNPFSARKKAFNKTTVLNTNSHNSCT